MTTTLDRPESAGTDGPTVSAAPKWQLAVASFLPPERRASALPWIARVPLALILVMQAAFTLRLTNSAFRDEALYIWTGHRVIEHLLHGAVLYDNPTSYFSGSPFFYPVIAAVLDSVGGVTLVRLFSLVLMLAATVSVYSFATRLCGRRVGLVAAASFALAGPTMHLSNFATFDALALSLIAVSIAIGARAIAKGSLWYIGVVGVLLSAAVLSKYAALMFVPFALAVMAFTPPRRTAAIRFAGLAAVMTAGVLTLLALTISQAELAGLQTTTTNRSAIVETSAWTIATQAWRFVGPWYVVAVIGLVVCAVTRRQVLLPVLLLAATLAPAIYHMYIHESVSLDKHLDFGLVFAAPLIGLAASVTRRTWQRLAVGVGAAWLVLSGLASSKFIYGEWANTKPLVDVMAYAFDSAPYIRTLGDVYEPARYHFQDTTEYWQWDTTDSIFYQDPERGDLQGLEAAKEGLHDRYWQYVYFDENSTGISKQIAPLMSEYGYRLTDKVTLANNAGDDVYDIWQNFDPPPTN